MGEGGIERAIASVTARALSLEEAEIDVARLAGDASSRGFFRVSFPSGSVVAVHYPAPFDASETSGDRLDRWIEARPNDGLETFANDPISHVELTALLPRFGVPVPGTVAVSGTDALVVVDDEGDTMLQGWLVDASPADRVAAYERAVDLIAGFRAATDAVTGTNTAAARLAFDERKLGWELEFFRANTFEHYLAAPLEEDLYAEARESFRELAAELAARPRVLCHRDYHARNLMLKHGQMLEGEENLVVIDFQDARLGPVTYDLVSILEDPYVPLDAGIRSAMRERFAERLRADGEWPGEDAFSEEYDLMAVQRLLKAVGTYTHQAAVRGNTAYVPYIAPALAEARAALGRLGRFPALGRAIARVASER